MPAANALEKLMATSRSNAAGPRRGQAEEFCQGLGGVVLRRVPPQWRPRLLSRRKERRAAGVGLAAAKAAPEGARAKGNNEEGRREGRGPGTEPREPPAEASSPTRLCYQSERLAAAVPPLPPFPGGEGLPEQGRVKRGLERSVARAVRPPLLV